MSIPRMPMEFDLTAEHLKLLRAAYVRWEDCETGAPAIDCKRPYGNSDVAADVAEVLGVEIQEGDEERLMDLHRETLTALQVVLNTRQFKPGRYRRVPDRGLERYNERDWEAVE